MDRICSVLTLLLSLIGYAALLPVGDAQAGTVSVTGAPCAAEITVQADEAMLSEVFKALSDTLGFALLFDRGSDRSVSIDTTRVPEKLIDSLTRDDNVMVTTIDDPDCAGQKRVTEVRFLAAGDPIFYPAHEPATAPPMVLSPVSLRKSQSGALKQNDEDRKRRRDMTPEERQKDRQQRRRGK